MSQALHHSALDEHAKRPTWLVTGASGFLGANIGAFLGGQAERIAVTRDGAAPSLFDSAMSGDLADPGALAHQIRDLKPDVIVHSAALASHAHCEQDPHQAHLINAHATGLLASAAHDVGARFVYISTDAVFDGEQGNYTEDDTPSPKSVYGRTKLEGEAQAQQATDTLIIRTNFFGWSPSGRRSIMEFFVNELAAGHPVRGFTDFTTTSAYAQVLAETIRDLIDREATGTFHVTSPDALTKYDFGVAVAEVFGLDPGLISPATAGTYPPRNGDISLDVSKVQAILGSTLPTQREGIQRAHGSASTLRQRLTARPQA